MIYIKSYGNIDSTESMHIDNLIELSDTDFMTIQKIKAVKDNYDLSKIKTRPDGRFYIYIDRKQIIAPTKDKLIEKPYKLLEKKITLAELYEKREYYCKEELSNIDKTIREHKFIWNNQICKEDIVNKAISELTTKDFLSYFRKITSGRAIKSHRFNDIKSVLNGIMMYAIEQELISTNPILNINMKQFKFKPTDTKAKPYTVPEREKVISHIKSKENDLVDLAIILVFSLIARIGEIKALRFDDVNNDLIKIECFINDKGKIQNHVKGNANEGFQWIPLTAQATQTLKEIKESNPSSEFMFMVGEKNITTVTFNRRLKKYCEELNIEYRSSHKIRFSTASIAYNKGMKDTELQELLGHSTLARLFQSLCKL